MPEGRRMHTILTSCTLCSAACRRKRCPPCCMPCRSRQDEDARERFLREWLPEFEDIYDLLTDFRFGGYRILGDIVCDMEDENTGREKKQLFRESDSKAFTAMMSAFADKSASRSYRDAVTAKCRELLTAIVRPALAVRYVVALGRRDLLWELLPEYIEKNVLEVRDD